MAIKANFKRETVKAQFDDFIDLMESELIKVLQSLGEKCVSHAKSLPAEVGFMDQTGNLRSSIGYVVFKNGVAVHSAYESVKEGTEGAKKGAALAEKIADNHKEGICLVVTAGMNYALYVESKGRDVLSSAEHLAQQELPRMLADLVEDFNKATK